MQAQGATSPPADSTWGTGVRATGVRGPRWPADPTTRAGTIARDTWILPATLGLIVGASLLVSLVGADARWLAALGRDIALSGHIPRGVPFAAAPTTSWHNVTVLGELVFAALESLLGDRGFVVAQAAAVAAAFALLAWDAVRAGAGREATATTCLVTAVGVAPSLAIARGQLFSLVLFPALLVLLRGDSRRPSRRVWLVVPLLCLWSNLHGAVLAGLLVTLIYLALARLRERPVETITLGLACVAALCANPAGLGAFAYYHGVLVNAAAQRGQGMWGPLSPTAPADALLILTVIVLARRAHRTRLGSWEIVALVALAVMTVHASRSGVWLAFVLVTPSALGARTGSCWRWRSAVIGAAAAVSLGLGAIQGPAPTGADARMIAQALTLAGRSPILASDIAAEQIALAGGTVWASDPIDAFPHHIQVAYLEWLAGDRAALAVIGRDVSVVLVTRPSPEARLMEHTPGFRVIARTDGSELLARSPGLRGRSSPRGRLPTNG